MTLPADGSPDVAVRDAGTASGDSPPTAAQLAESRVSWLTTEPSSWPLIPLWPMLDRTAGRLAELVSAVCGPDARDVVDSYLRSIAGDLSRLACRVAAELASAASGTEPATEAELMASLVSRYAARAATRELEATRRPLVNQIRHALGTHGHAFGEMIQRLRVDIDAVRTLLPEVRPGDLRAVRAAGDLHEAGAVMVLSFSEDRRLVYKPRSLALEQALAAFFSWIEHREPGLAPGVPESVDRGGYGWQRYVAWTRNGTRESATGFYRRVGALTAVAYALRATDLHLENVRCDVDVPVVTDPECFFGASFRTTADGENELLGTKAVTVLESTLLPDPGRRGDVPRVVDVSLLGSVGPRGVIRPGRERHDDEPSGPVRAPAPATDEPGHAPAKVDGEPGHAPGAVDGEPAHAPAVDGEPVPVQGFEDVLVDGFERTYRLLMRERDVLRAAGGPLAACGTARVRHIVRPTWQYVKILAELGSPGAAGSAREQEEIINALWPATAHERPLAVDVFGHERRGLLRGCVPTFERLADGVDLMGGGDVIHEGALHVSGLRLVRQRLGYLSQADLALQVRLVRAALRLPTIPTGAKANIRYAPTQGPPPSRTTVVDAAIAIGNRLIEQRATSHGRVWWLTGQELGDDRYCLRPGTAGLYDGVAGIALFAGYLEAVTGTCRPLALAAVPAMLAEAERLMAGSTIELLARNGQLAVAEGIWGCVYAAGCLGASLSDEALLTWARDVAAALVPALPHARAWDFVSGTAGVAAAAAALASGVGGHAFEASTSQALQATSRHLEEILAHREIQVGMAHGMSGAALAFARGARLLGDTDCALAASVCVEAERSMLRGSDVGWYDALLGGDADQRAKREGWCRGAGGIGLARVALADLAKPAGESAAAGDGYAGAVDRHAVAEDGYAAAADGYAKDGFAAEIDLAVRLATRRGLGGDQSLCHGAPGVLEFLRAAGQVEAYQRYFGGFVAAGRRDGWRTGLPSMVPDPGLFTGIAGVGYSLLRHLEPGFVPRVLTLDAPGRHAATGAVTP